MSFSTKRNPAIDRMRSLSPICGPTEKELAYVDRLTYEFAVPAGTVVIAEGDSPRGFFLVVSGLVEVSVAGMSCGELGPGAFFGEISMFDLGPEPETVTAVTPSVLRVATRPEFRELIAAPRIARSMMLTLAARQRVALGYRRFVPDAANDRRPAPSRTAATGT